MTSPPSYTPSCHLLCKFLPDICVKGAKYSFIISFPLVVLLDQVYRVSRIVVLLQTRYTGCQVYSSSSRLGIKGVKYIVVLLEQVYRVSSIQQFFQTRYTGCQVYSSSSRLGIQGVKQILVLLDQVYRVSDIYQFYQTKVVIQGKLFQRCAHLLYCTVLSLGGNVNPRRMSKPEFTQLQLTFLAL